MKRQQAGLTMVELLIAMVLSILVVDGALSLLLANRNLSNTTAGLSAVSDNGRVAVSFLSEAVRSGGYMACNATNDLREIVPVGQTRQINILVPGVTPVQRNYGFAFGGFEAANSKPGSALTVAAMPIAGDGNAGDWINAGGLDGLLLGKVTKGTDVLVVRESLPQTIPIYTSQPFITATGQVNLNVFSSGNLQPGQFAVISNCIVSTAFQVAAVSATQIGTAGALDQYGGDLLWSYASPASITAVDMYIYFIGPGRDTDSSLWVFDEMTQTFQELVPDVENMQVLYGVAPTTPNQVTEYLTADQVVDFNQIVSVKVGLLVASPPGVAAVTTATAATVQTFSLLNTTVTPPLDGRMRKEFDTTITVRSASL